jgi:acyl-CoA synthetase (AMP-forming)/AMP-acid ligase II
MGLRDFNIYHLLQHNALVMGDAPAVFGGSAAENGIHTLSHRQFLERVDRLAAGFAARRIGKGDRVAILAQNSAAYLELYGACAKTGAVACPINWRLTGPEVEAVIALVDPQMLVVDASQLNQVTDLDLRGLRVRAITGAGTAPDNFTPLSDLYEDSVVDTADVQGDDPFAILPTAAVSGVPRGAVLTHHNLIMAGYVLIIALGLTSQDRQLAALPFFHITGLGLALCMMQVGGANVVMETFDPARAAQWIDEHQVTLMADFPPVLSMLLDARAQSGAAWHSLKYVAGLDAPETIQRLYTETQAKFWTGFGQSETSGVVTFSRVDERPGSAGRPVPVMRIRCVNEAGHEVPVGTPGEIAVQGPLVFAGYWRDPDTTQYALRRGWHHTGDLGKFDSDGYLYYMGRKPEKELIKSGGENVYPAEVEQAIAELPEVESVCVIGVPHKKWGEAVKAIVACKAGETLSEEQVINAVTSRIAAYKKPQVVTFVEEIPRQENGEIDRAAVKAAHGDN